MMMRASLETEQDTIRILLPGGTSMIGEAIEAMLEREADFEVVGKATDPLDLLVAVAETRADVVIHPWPDSGQVPAVCTHLLMEYPYLLIIGIPTTADQMYVCRQVVLTTSLPAGKPQNLVSEIRRHWPQAETVHASEETA